jgi:hypothetical protein
MLKGRLIMLVLLDGSMWEGAPLYTCSHTKTSVTDVTSGDCLQHKRGLWPRASLLSSLQCSVHTVPGCLTRGSYYHSTDSYCVDY